MSHESSQSSSLPAGLVGVAVDFDPFASDAPVIERVIIPTDTQREVWLADHMSQEASLAYNEAVELSLKGPLDDAAIARLREACRAVFAAHQALRAVFSDDGSEMLMQTVSNPFQPRCLAFGNLFTQRRIAPASERQQHHQHGHHIQPYRADDGLNL